MDELHSVATLIRAGAAALRSSAPDAPAIKTRRRTAVGPGIGFAAWTRSQIPECEVSKILLILAPFQTDPFLLLNLL